MPVIAKPSEAIQVPFSLSASLVLLVTLTAKVLVDDGFELLLDLDFGLRIAFEAGDGARPATEIGTDAVPPSFSLIVA